MKTLTIAIGCAAVLMAASAQAATINVGGRCNLQRAIVSANNDASRFCVAGRGADTINLPANKVFKLTRVNNRDRFNDEYGLPVIRSTMTINGNGSTIRRAPKAPEFGIFNLNLDARLVVNDVKVSGGKAQRNDSGAAFNANGAARLSLHRVAVINNSVGVSVGESIEAGTGFLLIDSSTVAYNDYGVFSNKTPLRITHSTIAYNRVYGLGAGSALFEIQVSRTIIVGNKQRAIQSFVGANGEAPTIRSGGFNLIGGETPDNYAASPTDVLLPMLANPGSIVSPALTPEGVLPLSTELATSTDYGPAIDAVNDGTGCPATDQRGVVRPQDGNGDGGPACDIGAFEFVP